VDPHTPSEARWWMPLMFCLVAMGSGAAMGAVTNAINGQVSADYFAIVMCWDGLAASRLAIFQGVLEGGAMGVVFGICFAIVIAASTRMRCPIRLALKALAIALAIVAVCWVIGGIVGVVLSRFCPQLWGYFFIGVPPRVS